MDIIAIILIAAFASTIIGFGVYHLIRYLKGSVKITLDKTAYFAQETITGKAQLKAKKQIQGNRLFVALVGERQERKTVYSSKRNRTKKEWVEFFREEQNLEGQKNYSAGYSNMYDINIKIPDMGKAGAIMENAIVKTALSFMGAGRIRWKVEARLDAAGVDLYSKKKVSINMNAQNKIN